MDPHDVDIIASEIKQRGYRRIAIQSSDVEVATTLSTDLSTRFSSDTEKRELYVLGDVFIGSCCTDLTAARRCSADYVLHIGPSCQSSLVPSMPVRMLFDKAPIDPSELVTNMKRVLNERVYKRLVLIYDPAFHYLLDIFSTILSESTDESYIAECRDMQAGEKGDSDLDDVQNRFCGRTLFSISASKGKTAASCSALCIGDTSTLVLYIGMDSQGENTTNHIALSCSGSQFHVITLSNGVLNHRNADDLGDKLRQKRYRNVEKVLSASTIGILVISRNLMCAGDLRYNLSRLIESKGKKSYTFSVNCMTEAKLANFPNIDIYCLLSCGESLLSLPDELSRRTVAPFELLVALDCIDWSCPYEFEFSKLLPYTSIPEGEEGDNENRTEIRKLQGNCELKIQIESFVNSLSDNSKRTFRGVDPDHGISDTPTIIQGFHGTASGYEHERRL